MALHIERTTITTSKRATAQGWSAIAHEFSRQLPQNYLPFRSLITGVSEASVTWEVTSALGATSTAWGSLLDGRKQTPKRRGKQFVVASILPTGLRAEFGGFAGDATPITNLLANACDVLLTNPNAVTASDLYYADAKVLVLEGNILCHYLVGNVQLIASPPRSIGVVVSKPVHERYLNNVVNAVNGMRTVAGMPISKVVITEENVSASSIYADEGHASGDFPAIDAIVDAVHHFSNTVEAVALASPIIVDEEVRTAYYKGVPMANPWGAAEAMLTHCLTSVFSMPITHAPLLEDDSHTMMGTTCDPRDGAELISSAYICSVISGLWHSPRPLRIDQVLAAGEESLTNADLSAIVMPANAIGGLPFFAALERNIPIILVENNTTCSDITIESLGISAGAQVIKVHSYFEAAGVLTAMKANIALESLIRPIDSVAVEYITKAKLAASRGVA